MSDTDLVPAEERRLSLLYVDDDPILREFALVNLGTPAWTVSVAADGEEGLRQIARNRPDLVLLDLHMPKMNGFQVLRALRADDSTRRLPVIVITSRDDEASIDTAFSAGATSFLIKPINWRQVIYQIRFVDRANRTELALLERAEEIARRRRELEVTSAELAAALRAADVASEAKSQFLATVSHELRTPLNAVVGFSEILASEAFGALGDPRYREFVSDILSSSRRLLSLINDVLEFSRATSGNAVLDEEEFRLEDLIEEVCHAAAPQAAEGAVAVQIQSRSASPVVLRGDLRQIRRVLGNLLSNAIKFTPADGVVTITTEVEGGLAITVRDTGIGISAEDLAKVLQHFGRVENGLAREHNGIGLGLPLARQFMTLHGGTLSIESEPNIGTAVTVIFPDTRVVRADASTAFPR